MKQEIGVGRRPEPVEVLQVITDTDRRGAQIFACDLEDALAAPGRRVRTVALTPGMDSEGLPVRCLGSRSLVPATLLALRRQARSARVVAAHGSSTLPAVAMALAGTGIPFVYRSIGDPLYWSGTKARRARMRMLLSRPAIVVALWPGSARALRDQLGVPQDRIRTIPSGVPADRFPRIDSASRRSARERYGFPSDARVLAYVGSLSHEKNVEAAISLPGSLADAYLLVVGSGPLRGRLEEMARTVAPGRVRFTGPLRDPHEAVAAADLLVLPSRSEGIPGVLIEAAFRGLPSVATAVGGVREVVLDGETGFLVPPGDQRALAEAVHTLLQSSDGMGERAREHCIRRFEMSVVANEWDAVLEELGAWTDATG